MYDVVQEKAVRRVTENHAGATDPLTGERLRKYDGFIFYFTGHGGQGEKILFSNDNYRDEENRDAFSTAELAELLKDCPPLKNLPTLVILDCCRSWTHLTGLYVFCSDLFFFGFALFFFAFIFFCIFVFFYGGWCLLRQPNTWNLLPCYYTCICGAFVMHGDVLQKSK